MPSEHTPAHHKSYKTSTDPYVQRLPNINWQAQEWQNAKRPGHNPEPPD